MEFNTRAGQPNNARSETASDEIRHLDEDRARVASEARNDLLRERITAVVVQIVVISGVESGAGTRRPAKQRLRAEPRVERVVVEYDARKSRFGELISTAQRQNVDGIRDAVSVVAAQPLRVHAELRTQCVSWLIRKRPAELQQTAATGI